MNNNIVEGQFVKIVGKNINGIVINIKNNKVTLECNNIKYETNLNNVKPIDKQHKNKQSYKINIVNKYSNFNPEIDLHGCNVDESLKKLDKFIDSAILHNHDFLKIIHGKGEGILKKAIRSSLKKDIRVNQFINNHIYSHNYGITVIELK